MESAPVVEQEILHSMGKLCAPLDKLPVHADHCFNVWIATDVIGLDIVRVSHLTLAFCCSGVPKNRDQ